MLSNFKPQSQPSWSIAMSNHFINLHFLKCDISIIPYLRIH